ncbi:hypothetical protein Gotur_024980 [Gossypium turneri]
MGKLYNNISNHCRLFLMLQRFPVKSKGRRKKLQEVYIYINAVVVGYATTICFTCFLVRCIMMCFNAFDKGADLDVLNHPILNLIYYLVSLMNGAHAFTPFIHFFSFL